MLNQISIKIDWLLYKSVIFVTILSIMIQWYIQYEFRNTYIIFDENWCYKHMFTDVIILISNIAHVALYIMHKDVTHSTLVPHLTSWCICWVVLISTGVWCCISSLKVKNYQKNLHIYQYFKNVNNSHYGYHIKRL